MVRALLFFSCSILFFHCKKENESMAPSPAPPVAAAKRYLALGDSYTIGQSVTEPERFPVQTRTWLNAQGIDMSMPDIIATTGWTTSNLQNAVATQNPMGSYDVVTLLIGVNDQYQLHDTTGYRARFSALLDKAIHLAGDRRDRVFVLSIPDYSVTPFAQVLDTARIHYEIDQFNSINRNVAGQYFCQYLDITPSTRQAAYDLSLIASDGLHPSGKEYKKWADRLGPMMKAVLQ